MVRKTTEKAVSVERGALGLRPEVILTMDETTASTIAEVLSHVGGSPSGPRGRADAVLKALRGAAVPRVRHTVKVTGGVYIDEPRR